MYLTIRTDKKLLKKKIKFLNNIWLGLKAVKNHNNFRHILKKHSIEEFYILYVGKGISKAGKSLMRVSIILYYFFANKENKFHIITYLFTQ
jgi:hypothetical protein